MQLHQFTFFEPHRRMGVHVTAGTAAAVLATACVFVVLPEPANAAGPSSPVSTSYYVTSNNVSAAQDGGRALGIKARDTGCPSNTIPAASNCKPGWPASAIWTVSWSGPAYPLPEIYSNTLALQWKYLSLYSYKNYGTYFQFQGTLTQQGACQQNTGAATCVGTNQDANTAWGQLWVQLGSTPAAGGTSKLYGSATDIKWNL